MVDLESAIRTVRGRFPTGTRTYECALCSRSFERELLNCPACGCSKITRA